MVGGIYNRQSTSIISFPFMLSTLVHPLNISSDNIAWLTRRHRTRTASSEYLIECVLGCGYQLVFVFKVIAVVVLRRSKGIVVNDVGSVSIIIHELVLLVRSLR